MDDNRFDEIIKGKVGEYESRDYNPADLEAFHARMAAAVHYPWYVRYRREMITAAATILIGSLVVLGQAVLHRNSMEELYGMIGELRKQNDQLQESVTNLRDHQPAKDTVRITEYREAPNQYIQRLADQVALLQARLEVRDQTTLPETNESVQLVFAGSLESIPEETLKSLRRDHNVLEESGNLFLLIDRESIMEREPEYLARRNNLHSEIELPEYIFIIDSIKPDLHVKVATRSREKTVKIPVRQLREMEGDRYSGGIGIELGPSADIYRSFYSVGHGEAAFGVGMLANFITSPRLSIESGALFNMTRNYTGPDETSKLNLPPADSDYGDFNGIEMTSWFMELPVSLKYRYRISATNHLVGGIGLSAYLYTRQEFEYMYDYEVGGGLIAPIEKSIYERDPALYFGSANLSLGLSSNLKNGKRLEANVFYKKSLSQLGREESDAGFLGIRTSYMFSVR